MSKSLFLVAVTAIIENNSTNKILLIRRSDTSDDFPGCWEDVGGRLMQSESPEEGLKREIKEETGISDIEIIKPLTTFHVFRHGIEKIENELIGISYWCKTNSFNVILSDEHSDFRWVLPHEASVLTDHPILKNYLQIYLEEKKLSEKISYMKIGREIKNE